MVANGADDSQRRGSVLETMLLAATPHEGQGRAGSTGIQNFGGFLSQPSKFLDTVEAKPQQLKEPDKPSFEEVFQQEFKAKEALQQATAMLRRGKRTRRGPGEYQVPRKREGLS